MSCTIKSIFISDLSEIQYILILQYNLWKEYVEIGSILSLSHYSEINNYLNYNLYELNY